MAVEDRYLDGSYLAANPTWDSEDGKWKAGKVAEILAANRITPSSVCDIGCGSGSVLVTLRDRLPNARLFGYDISPQLERSGRSIPTSRSARKTPSTAMNASTCC